MFWIADSGVDCKLFASKEADVLICVNLVYDGVVSVIEFATLVDVAPVIFAAAVAWA